MKISEKEKNKLKEFKNSLIKSKTEDDGVFWCKLLFEKEAKNGQENQGYPEENEITTKR